MKFRGSIRARLLLGAALVLLAFLAGAGLAVQRAHADSVRAAHFARLQSTVYLLLARAELDDGGALVMPPALAEPRLSLPASGLYASIYNVDRREEWQSPSTLGLHPPFRARLRDRPVALRQPATARMAPSWPRPTASSWADRRHAPRRWCCRCWRTGRSSTARSSVFTRTLWAWLGGAGLLLLLAQTLLLRWGLAPLRRVAGEIRRIESGEQDRIEGRYPTEICGLTDNLNTLIQQERVPADPLQGGAELPGPQPEDAAGGAAQRAGRAGAAARGGRAAGGAHGRHRAAPAGPRRRRRRRALRAAVWHWRRCSSASAMRWPRSMPTRAWRFTLDCPPDLTWRIDEGDLFEILGNVMDNAAKWAKHRVEARIWRDGGRLLMRVEDDGPGFSDTESVLQLHVRLDERVPGHGVGLAVVNDLVASHQGELKISRGPWGGAQLDIVLRAA